MTVQREWVIPMWSFGDRIRKIRTDLGMTQVQFAESLGVTSNALAQWESDRNQPRRMVEVAEKIEELYKVPAAWVLGVDIAPFPVTASEARQLERELHQRSLRLPRLDSNQQPFGLRSAHLLKCIGRVAQPLTGDDEAL